jgi:hypothetical protein
MILTPHATLGAHSVVIFALDAQNFHVSRVTEGLHQ